MIPMAYVDGRHSCNIEKGQLLLVLEFTTYCGVVLRLVHRSDITVCDRRAPLVRRNSPRSVSRYRNPDKDEHAVTKARRRNSKGILASYIGKTCQ